VGSIPFDYQFLNLVVDVENMLLFKINYKNVSSEWTVTISEQVRTNDTSLSTCVTPDINWTSPNSDK
jgi:hypothetical protein